MFSFLLPSEKPWFTDKLGNCSHIPHINSPVGLSNLLGKFKKSSYLHLCYGWYFKKEDWKQLFEDYTVYPASHFRAMRFECLARHFVLTNHLRCLIEFCRFLLVLEICEINWTPIAVISRELRKVEVKIQRTHFYTEKFHSTWSLAGGLKYFFLHWTVSIVHWGQLWGVQHNSTVFVESFSSPLNNWKIMRTEKKKPTKKTTVDPWTMQGYGAHRQCSWKSASNLSQPSIFGDSQLWTENILSSLSWEDHLKLLI